MVNLRLSGVFSFDQSFEIKQTSVIKKSKSLITFMSDKGSLPIQSSVTIKAGVCTALSCWTSSLMRGLELVTCNHGIKADNS